MPSFKLPDRWENYTNIGKVIEGTKILTFKVPLNETLCSKYPENLWFTPKTLMESLEAGGTPLGLIIDLTFTTRYYNPIVFTEKGISYEKIFVPGKEVPSRKIIKKFCKVIDDFVSDPKNAERLVGVHCTHGVNRTGHLVCRYMIDKLNIDPEVAIEAYSTARGYPIERENYLADLRDTTREEDGESDDDEDETEEKDDADKHRKEIQHGRPWDINSASGRGWSGHGSDNHRGSYRDRNADWRDRSWRGPRHYNDNNEGYNRQCSHGDNAHSDRHWNRDFRHSQDHRHDNSYSYGNNSRHRPYNNNNQNDNRDYHSRRADPPYGRQSSWNKRSYGNHGNWSLNNDSDYGQFGRSYHGNSSKNTEDPQGNCRQNNKDGPPGGSQPSGKVPQPRPNRGGKDVGGSGLPGEPQPNHGGVGCDDGQPGGPDGQPGGPQPFGIVPQPNHDGVDGGWGGQPGGPQPFGIMPQPNHGGVDGGWGGQPGWPQPFGIMPQPNHGGVDGWGGQPGWPQPFGIMPQPNHGGVDGGWGGQPGWPQPFGTMPQPNHGGVGGGWDGQPGEPQPFGQPKSNNRKRLCRHFATKGCRLAEKCGFLHPGSNDLPTGEPGNSEPVIQDTLGT